MATLKVRLAKRQRQHSILPLNLKELKEQKAVQFAAEMTDRFTALEAAQDEVTPEDLWKGTKTVLMEVARETIGSIKSQKKKKRISDMTFAAIRETREAKGKLKNRYQELKAEVQRKLRMDKQQQLGGMCVELEAAHTKGNSRQLFQIVISMTQKFQLRLQCIQSATGENLTEAAQVVRWNNARCEQATKTWIDNINTWKRPPWKSQLE